MMRSEKRTKTVLVCVAAGGLVVFGALGLLRGYQATHNPKATIPSGTVTHTTDKPDETPVTELCESYSVPDDQPRKIELPRLQVSGCIVRVGIDQHGAIAAPTNIHLAGWYEQSVLPGKQGISVIDGHAGGRYTDGIFKSLHLLRSGDVIRIQLGSGIWREFIVETSESYPPKQSVKELLQPLPDVRAQLSLITCTGSFDDQMQTYAERLVVRARLR